MFTRTPSGSLVLFPRLQLFEIADQPWCPAWVREHSHAMLARMWAASNTPRGSPAAQASELLLRAVGGAEAASGYTFVDACAGAGGPTPLMARAMNAEIVRAGLSPARFVLTDMWPDLAAWRRIAERDANVGFVERPTDATVPVSHAVEGTKECRVFNLCFHHFDDDGARRVLASAVRSADAFMIFEIDHRTVSCFLNVTLVVLATFVTTLIDFWWSPVHLIFQYLVPLIPLSFAWDGYVSCARVRTAEETWALLSAQQGLDLSEWDLQSGEQTALWPFGQFYWYSGVKRSLKGK